MVVKDCLWLWGKVYVIDNICCFKLVDNGVFFFNLIFIDLIKIVENCLYFCYYIYR